MLLRILPSQKDQLHEVLPKILLSQIAQECRLLRLPVRSYASLGVVVAAAAAAVTALVAPAVVMSPLALQTFSSAWRLQHHLLQTAPAAVREANSKRPAERSSGWASQTA